MRKLVVWTLMVVLLLALVACGTENGSNKENNTQTNVENGAKPTAAFPLTVKDASGVEMTFEKAPERIISTSSSETEILFALGLGDRIYGVSDYDNYPEEALSKPKIGGVWDPNEEVILASEPDLVIGGISMNEDIAERLRSLGITLYKAEPNSVEDVLDTILQLGRITGTQEKAEQLVAKMRDDIRRVTEAAATIKEEDRKQVYLEFAPGWTVGKGEFLDELITMAGGVNIMADVEGWVQINEETVIHRNPDVILYAADLIDFDTGKPLDEIITSRSGWSSITAIKDNKLVPLDEDIMSRTGPRLTEGLLMVVEGIYPGLVQR